jgi:hypothetical protein
VEDLADNQTRRVLETQSDLMQRDRLDALRENDLRSLQTWFNFSNSSIGLGNSPDQAFQSIKFSSPDLLKKHNIQSFEDIEKTIAKLTKEAEEKKDTLYDKLVPYENHWWKRILREEIKQAANDGKKKVQFPDGETAMRIEKHLNEDSAWKYSLDNHDEVVNGLNYAPDATPNNLKVGKILYGPHTDAPWIVSKVGEGGKFNLLQKWMVNEEMERLRIQYDGEGYQRAASEKELFEEAIKKLEGL